MKLALLVCVLLEDNKKIYKIYPYETKVSVFIFVNSKQHEYYKTRRNKICIKTKIIFSSPAAAEIIRK